MSCYESKKKVHMYRLTNKFHLVCTGQCLLYNLVICCVPNSCGGCWSFIFFLSGGNGTSDSRACCGTKTAVVETSVTGWRLKYILLDLVSSCYHNNLLCQVVIITTWHEIYQVKVYVCKPHRHNYEVCFDHCMFKNLHLGKW